MNKLLAKMFPGLRSVAWLKRIALALEEANEIQRERMALAYPEYARKHRKAPRKTEISTPTVEQWNSEWERRHQL